jgi:DNA repair protein RadC
LALQPKEGNTDTSPHLYDVFQALIWTQGDDFAGLGERGAVKKLRDRVLMYGVGSLSNVELFAIVLSTGEGSENVLGRIYKLLENHSFVDLMRIDIGELLKKHRLGVAKATQLQSLLEIARRLTIPQANEKYQIRSPADAARLMFPEMSHLDHEEMRVLVLDTKNYVVANILLYRGTVNSSVVRTAEVFKHAISRNFPGIIIFHNHPSGSVEPSPEDIAVTNQIVEAGKLVEVELIDHIIIGGQNFLSLKEKMRWS